MQKCKIRPTDGTSARQHRKIAAENLPIGRARLGACLGSLVLPYLYLNNCQPIRLMGLNVQKEGTVLVMPKKDPAFQKAVLEAAGAVLNSALTNPMFGML